MPHPRFTTARDLFDSFETAREDIAAEATDHPSLEFLNSLVADGDLRSAVAFCAYLLPRREAVWWACQCLRSMIAHPSAADERNLRAAEAWVSKPEEELRLIALDIGMQSDKKGPGAWVALAAAWSGGRMIRSEHKVASAPPNATPKAVIGAILLCTAGMLPDVRVQHLRNCVQSAIRLLQNDRS